VIHIYIPAVLSVNVPPKIQLFLWLLSHNKLATIDNLNKKGMSKPTQCCFCAEDESTGHLFFECVVAREIWRYVCAFLGIGIGHDYLSVTARWLQKKEMLWCEYYLCCSVAKHMVNNKRFYLS
jgi:hypothetical protein